MISEGSASSGASCGVADGSIKGGIAKATFERGELGRKLHRSKDFVNGSLPSSGTGSVMRGNKRTSYVEHHPLEVDGDHENNGRQMMEGLSGIASSAASYPSSLDSESLVRSRKDIGISAVDESFGDCRGRYDVSDSEDGEFISILPLRGVLARNKHGGSSGTIGLGRRDGKGSNGHNFKGGANGGLWGDDYGMFTRYPGRHFYIVCFLAVAILIVGAASGLLFYYGYEVSPGENASTVNAPVFISKSGPMKVRGRPSSVRLAYGASYPDLLSGDDIESESSLILGNEDVPPLGFEGSYGSDAVDGQSWNGGRKDIVDESADGMVSSTANDPQRLLRREGDSENVSGAVAVDDVGKEVIRTSSAAGEGFNRESRSLQTGYGTVIEDKVLHVYARVTPPVKPPAREWGSAKSISSGNVHSSSTGRGSYQGVRQYVRDRAYMSSRGILRSIEDSSDDISRSIDSPSPRSDVDETDVVNAPSSFGESQKSYRKPHLIQIASHSNRADAEKEIVSAQSKYKVLAGMQSSIQLVNLASRGVFYRVRFAADNNEKAVEVCEELRRLGCACIVAW